RFSAKFQELSLSFLPVLHRLHCTFFYLLYVREWELSTDLKFSSSRHRICKGEHNQEVLQFSGTAVAAAGRQETELMEVHDGQRQP
ncbi:MAG: hypothetical protein PHX57_09325, partial [Desulfobulbaceae bacterium]|nr:hypothetical protein [Desulfobulbaceae bacterium]